MTANLEADEVADDITASLKLDLESTDSDKNIIFHVSGYFAPSTVAATKCGCYRESLIAGIDITDLHLVKATDASAYEFLQQISRGGLAKPTDFVFKLAVYCWCVFQEIWTHGELKAKLLKATVHRVLFEKIMERATSNEIFVDLLVGRNMCSAGHDLQNNIVRRFFFSIASPRTL